MNRQQPKILGAVALCAAAVAADQPPRAASSMTDFDWLAGHWCLERDGRLVEEHWLPASGGMLLSVGRTVSGGAVQTFEFLRLELREGEVTFVAQPDGKPPVAYRLAAAGPDWARFENPAHDFPTRVEYRRADRGLHAEISGPGAGGREQTVSFDYLPCGG